MASYTTFWILVYLQLSPISMMHGVDEMITSFLQHCLGGKGDFQVTYKISVYYVTWRVADHLPKKGAPTAFATYRSPTISIN